MNLCVGRGIGSFFASDTEAALSDNINEFASSGRHRKTMLVSPSNRVISVNTQNSPTSGGKNLFGRRKFSLENRSSKNEDSLAEGNSQDHIKVCVRIRPMVPSEVEHSEVTDIKQDFYSLSSPICCLIVGSCLDVGCEHSRALVVRSSILPTNPLPVSVERSGSGE